MRLKQVFKRHKNSVMAGVKEGFPIFVGYFPVAIAYGLLAKSVPLKIAEAGMFSAIVFAGAAQFISASMLLSGAGIASIIVTTFLINSRHFLLSATVASRLTGTRRWHALAAFGVTDETFAVAATRPDTFGTPYLLGLNFTAWLGWLSGTITGHFAGGLLPAKMQLAMGILLYVMFLGILMPEVKKDKKVILVAVFSGVIHWLLRMLVWLPDGWCLVLAILISVFIIDFSKKKRNKVSSQ